MESLSCLGRAGKLIIGLLRGRELKIEGLHAGWCPKVVEEEEEETPAVGTLPQAAKEIHQKLSHRRLVREEVSLRREMQRRPEHSFHFSIASLLFSSHRDWACCLLPSVSQPSPDHVSTFTFCLYRARDEKGKGKREGAIHRLHPRESEEQIGSQ